MNPYSCMRVHESHIQALVLADADVFLTWKRIKTVFSLSVSVSKNLCCEKNVSNECEFTISRRNADIGPAISESSESKIKMHSQKWPQTNWFLSAKGKAKFFTQLHSVVNQSKNMMRHKTRFSTDFFFPSQFFPFTSTIQQFFSFPFDCDLKRKVFFSSSSSRDRKMQVHQLQWHFRPEKETRVRNKFK